MSEDQYGWRAGVYGEDPVSDGLRIVVGLRGPQVNQYVTGIVDGRVQMVSVEYGTEPPSLVIPIDMARALLDALSAHFGGSGTGRELRSDYLHERGRVDRLIGTLATVATREAS